MLFFTICCFALKYLKRNHLREYTCNGKNFQAICFSNFSTICHHRQCCSSRSSCSGIQCGCCIHTIIANTYITHILLAAPRSPPSPPSPSSQEVSGRGRNPRLTLTAPALPLSLSVCELIRDTYTRTQQASTAIHRGGSGAVKRASEAPHWIHPSFRGREREAEREVGSAGGVARWS